jgi:hypothetical protein
MSMFKGLHCQSAISRGFDDKGVFQKVSKSDATGGATHYSAARRASLEISPAAYNEPRRAMLVALEANRTAGRFSRISAFRARSAYRPILNSVLHTRAFRPAHPHSNRNCSESHRREFALTDVRFRG